MIHMAYWQYAVVLAGEFLAGYWYRGFLERRR